MDRLRAHAMRPYETPPPIPSSVHSDPTLSAGRRLIDPPHGDGFTVDRLRAHHGAPLQDAADRSRLRCIPTPPCPPDAAYKHAA